MIKIYIIISSQTAKSHIFVVIQVMVIVVVEC